MFLGVRRGDIHAYDCQWDSSNKPRVLRRCFIGHVARENGEAQLNLFRTASTFWWQDHLEWIGLDIFCSSTGVKKGFQRCRADWRQGGGAEGRSRTRLWWCESMRVASHCPTGGASYETRRTWIEEVRSRLAWVIQLVVNVFRRDQRSQKIMHQNMYHSVPKYIKFCILIFNTKVPYILGHNVW